MTPWIPSLNQIVEFRIGDADWTIGKVTSSDQSDGDSYWIVRPLGEEHMFRLRRDQMRVVRKVVCN